MKKLLCLSTFLLLSIFCILPTSASEILDFEDLLTETERLTLESTMDDIQERLNLHISILTPEDLGGFENITDYTQAYIDDTYTNDEHAIVLSICLRENTWTILGTNEGQYIASDYFKEFISTTCITDYNYGEYQKAFTDFVKYCDEFTVAYTTGNTYGYGHPYQLKEVLDSFTPGTDIVDLSELMSEDTKASMQSIIDDVRSKYDFNISVITVLDYGSFGTTRAFTDAVYEHMYGSEDGVILMLCLSQRDWYISTEGFGDFSINDYCLDRMEEMVIPSFSSGNYEEGFYTFVDLCSKFVEEAKTDTPYTYNNEYRTMYDYLKIGAIILVGSIVIALAYIVMLTRQMKNIRPVDSAGNYLSRDSFKLTNSSDQFLYSHVSKTVKPKSSSSGGRSGGSGGGSSGGRGGKF